MIYISTIYHLIRQCVQMLRFSSRYNENCILQMEHAANELAICISHFNAMKKKKK